MSNQVQQCSSRSTCSLAESKHTSLIGLTCSDHFAWLKIGVLGTGGPHSCRQGCCCCWLDKQHLRQFGPGPCHPQQTVTVSRCDPSRFPCVSSQASPTLCVALQVMRSHQAAAIRHRPALPLCMSARLLQVCRMRSSGSCWRPAARLNLGTQSRSHQEPPRGLGFVSMR